MRILFLGAAMLLSACTGTVSVPSANVEVPGSITPTAGRYAAIIQSGGWALQTKPEGWTCGAWTFNTDVNNVYESAMRDVLTRSLEKVEFVPAPVPPAELQARGYDAFFAVQQGNASSKFGVNPGFFTATANSSVELTSVLAITDERGAYYQQTINGRGGGSVEVITCPSIDGAISKAAQQAVTEIAKSSVLYIRDGLRERQLRKLQAGM